MHGQEIFQVFTDLNHSDLGLCTGWIPGRLLMNIEFYLNPDNFYLNPGSWKQYHSCSDIFTKDALFETWTKSKSYQSYFFAFGSDCWYSFCRLNLQLVSKKVRRTYILLRYDFTVSEPCYSVCRRHGIVLNRPISAFQKCGVQEHVLN